MEIKRHKQKKGKEIKRKKKKKRHIERKKDRKTEKRKERMNVKVIRANIVEKKVETRKRNDTCLRN